ncbi:MAG: alpha-amylase family glycosyl hydrolase [Lachnospiraceae bacterium]|nr:alpha-amylase family glycosyl hydrolase [Lachnospiraceae bacterium]
MVHNKRISRFFALFLAGLMAAMMLAGCTSSSKDTKDAISTEFVDEDNRIDDKYGTCYQVFLYSFCDSDGDGIGDIQGLISKLDYIQDMGFSSIWLLPFTKSTTYHKYDVVDYYTIDPQYGTMDDFDALVKACDERGLDIYMDFVINHTSSKNEWFKEACDYLGTIGDGEPDTSVCPYVDYYNFKKSDKVPSGWKKVSSNPSWIYECVFWAQMPDLNLSSKAVRTEIEKIAKFWIDKGISGFRLDAALHYFEADNPDSIEALSWFCDYVHGINPDIYCVAEVWDNFNTIKQFYQSSCDSMFDFTLGNQDGVIVKGVNNNSDNVSGAKMAENIVNVYNEIKSVNENAIDGVFLSNHDTGRAAGFLLRKDERVKLAAGIQILTTGNVFVYYGDELGMGGSGKDENKRAPMYWSDDENADGMTAGPPSYEPQTHSFGSYETQKDDDNSVYNYYRKAIHIRNKYPEIGRGIPSVMNDVTEQNGNLCAIHKTYNDSEISLIYNDSDAAVTVTVSKDTYKYETVVDYLVVNEELPQIKGEEITIPAYGCVIL